MFNEMEQNQDSNPIKLLVVAIAVLIVVGLAVWGGLKYYGQYREEKAVENPTEVRVSVEEKQAVLDALNKKSSATSSATVSEKEAILNALNKNTSNTKANTQTSQVTTDEKQAILDALNKK